MTYCDNQWISDYSYRGILDNLCNRERANCPNYGAAAPARRGAGGGAPVGRALRREEGRRPAARDQRVAEAADEKLKLSSVAAKRGLTLTRRPKKSPYESSSSAAEAASWPPTRSSRRSSGTSRSGAMMALIDEVVRFDRRTERVAITKGSKAIASRPVSASAPQVRVTSPRKGKRKLGKSVRVRWRASDADHDRLSYSLLYSGDGKNYIPVAAGLRKRSYKVDLRRLPGGRKAKFRVVANDGVLTGAARSRGKLRVAAKPPRVAILSPTPGDSLVEKTQIQLAASVDDLQDANVKRRNIVWRSSEQGILGRGSTVTTTLRPGSHEISVRARNSAGRTGKAKMNVEVAAVPPNVDAVLIP